MPRIRRTDVGARWGSLARAPSTAATGHEQVGQLLAGAVEDGLIPQPGNWARLPKREASKAQPVPLMSSSASMPASLLGWRSPFPSASAPACGREASGPAVDQIDFLRCTLGVDRQLMSRFLPSPVLSPPKTESSRRTIPLAAFLRDALADRLRRFPGGPGELVLHSPARLPVDSGRFARH